MLDHGASLRPVLNRVLPGRLGYPSGDRRRGRGCSATSIAGSSLPIVGLSSSSPTEPRTRSLKASSTPSLKGRGEARALGGPREVTGGLLHSVRRNGEGR